MITYSGKPFDDETSLGVLNKHVRAWFEGNFKELTPPQRFAFKMISEGKNLLITAPTGSGKTMSGFLSIISKLFDYSMTGTLEDKVYCIYVSPLRALNNDVYKNLSKPLAEIYARLTAAEGVNVIKNNIRNVTIGVRTGDTPQQERRKQLEKPPNILVTTPETLAILINSEKFVENLKGAEYLIIDEVHELANNKRGVHLSLSVVRLEDLIGRSLIKIGLGATLHPLDEAAKFLVGYGADGSIGDCTIVDASWSKKLDVKSISPVNDMIYTDGDKVEEMMYSELDRQIRASKSTIIFTNTRSGTERVVFNLKKRFKYADDIAAHHGSLSRESRLEVEEMLKKGSLKCVVSSTSLELGVDVGAVDNVLQLGSPKSVTRAVQRIGRAGHSFKSVAKGEIIVLNRDDLVECSVMLDAALRHHLDSFSVPKNALDVLAQHIIGMSLTRKWKLEEAFSLVRRAYPYHELTMEDFMSLIHYLAGTHVGLESRKVYGKIWYDENEGMFGRRGMMAKVIYMLNLGTIPDSVAINVYGPKKKWIGSIEEEFLAKLKPGDIFTLGGKLYKFEYAKAMKCYVTDASATAPTIPPWFSEQLPLSYELAIEIGKFRSAFADILRANAKRGASSLGSRSRIPEEASSFLSKMPIDSNSVRALYGYFMEQLLFAKEIPTDRFVLIECTRDPSSESPCIVFHSLFGRRVNDALSRAFALSLAEMFDTDVGIMTNDNGFVLTPAESVRITSGTVKDMLGDIRATGLSQLLKRNVRRTELMRRRFRQVAARSFMVLRNYKGWKISVGRQQFNSQLLLNAAEEIDPDFPVIRETYREIFNEVMDLPRAEAIVSDMSENRMRFKVISTPVPSPFSHSMLTFGHADAILLKERHEYLQKLHRLVMKRIKSSG